jgi:hypothetical protein
LVEAVDLQTDVVLAAAGIAALYSAGLTDAGRSALPRSGHRHLSP